MRTRFRPTDDITRAATGTLDFAYLPLPHFAPLNNPSFSANLIQCLHEIPVFGTSPDIEKLPIDDALSIFLSDVLPHKIDGADHEEWSNFDASWENLEALRLEEKDGTRTSNEGTGNSTTFMQFEIPEMNLPLLLSEGAALSQKESLDIFSEISDAECTLDLLSCDLMAHNNLDIQSVYSVDDMSMDYSMEQKADQLEDRCSFSGELDPHIRFPHFEVDEESMGLVRSVHIVEELLSFENVGTQELPQRDEGITNSKELLGSLEFDFVKDLLHHYVAEKCIGDTHVSSHLDCVSIVDLCLIQGKSIFHHRKEDDSIWSMDPLFDQYLFSDLDPFNFHEVFLDALTEITAEPCESMFGEAMNFRTLNELIISHELTLLDDSFKSLPVPILSDHGHNRPLHLFVEDFFAQLDWQSSSASDGLYLDWHYLGQDDCDSVKYSTCWKVVSEIEIYDIDAALEFSEGEILDLVFYEVNCLKGNFEKDKEMLNFPDCNVRIVQSSSGKVDSTWSNNNGEVKTVSEEFLHKSSAAKVPVLGKSMSSDLDYFLNRGRDCTTTCKLDDVNTMCQVFKISDNSTAKITSAVQQKSDVQLHNIELSDKPKNTNVEMTKDLGSSPAQKDGKFKLEDLLTTVPVKEAHDDETVKAVNEDANCRMVHSKSTSAGLELKQNLQCTPFALDTVIVVNTRKFNEEMVFSRRSTYQRILELEKGGAQVLERDINLPVDLIISPAVSLTWYDCKNIAKKVSAPEEAFSCLALCVESIAANILTSLSFAFSCCILIFEGESSFLSGIMESSDELYAAAASLGIDMQLFCSYSSDMTEEIILSCIRVASKSSMGLYPKMLDSESVAESFLTAFPSIHPLSAHAILSSGFTLGKFLELSNEGRISALKRYQVPDESIALLSAVSRYGEREDCRSGTTDCSSTDSKNIHLRSEPERKKARYTHNIYDAIEPPNDMFHRQSLNQLPDDQLNPPKWSVPCNSWLSEGAELSDKPGQFDSAFDEKLFSSHEFDATTFDISDDRGKSRIPVIDVDCTPGRRPVTQAMNNLSRQHNRVPGISQFDFVGEVIDVDNPATFREKFSTPKYGSFPPSPFAMEKDYSSRNSRMSELSSGEHNVPAYTNFQDTDSGRDAWISLGGDRQILREEFKPHYTTTVQRKNIPPNCQRGLFEKGMTGKAPQNTRSLTFQQTDTGIYDSPLSIARQSAQTQGSPWSIEFLNRIREKSRLRQQSLPNNLSPPCFPFSENTSKVAKRKSPSIFEFYKYEGSTPMKIAEKKKLKRTVQPQNSVKNDRASASSFPRGTPANMKARPQLTPLDKRSRRALAFSNNGNGGQRKLVWSEDNSQNSQRRS